MATDINVGQIIEAAGKAGASLTTSISDAVQAGKGAPIPKAQPSIDLSQKSKSNDGIDFSKYEKYIPVGVGAVALYFFLKK